MECYLCGNKIRGKPKKYVDIHGDEVLNRKCEKIGICDLCIKGD
jgi:hypothetical protein